MHELEFEYGRLKGRWNSFWQKLMAHPESPLADEWLSTFDEIGKQMTENFRKQLAIIEAAKHGLD